VITHAIGALKKDVFAAISRKLSSCLYLQTNKKLARPTIMHPIPIFASIKRSLYLVYTKSSTKNTLDGLLEARGDVIQWFT
jgi:hypothetical protein